MIDISFKHAQSLFIPCHRTWSGPAWSPAQSLSSVLISIQSLMNEKPYHNEPGFERVTVKLLQLIKIRSLMIPFIWYVTISYKQEHWGSDFDQIDTYCCHVSDIGQNAIDSFNGNLEQCWKVSSYDWIFLCWHFFFGFILGMFLSKKLLFASNK